MLLRRNNIHAYITKIKKIGNRIVYISCVTSKLDRRQKILVVQDFPQRIAQIEGWIKIIMILNIRIKIRYNDIMFVGSKLPTMVIGRLDRTKAWIVPKKGMLTRTLHDHSHGLIQDQSLLFPH